jgi:hypothetical protein
MAFPPKPHEPPKTVLIPDENASFTWVQAFQAPLSGFGAGFGDGVGVADATVGEMVTLVRMVPAAMRPDAHALRVFGDINDISRLSGVVRWELCPLSSCAPADRGISWV